LASAAVVTNAITKPKRANLDTVRALNISLLLVLMLFSLTD
jgi:hypothetical protein